MAKFSVVLIARNEEKTLPRLLESVKGVDEVIVVDTGSTDKTIEVAKSFGATVYENRFDIIIDEEMKSKIDELVGDNNIKVGDKAFNFAEARNWIAEKARNDMIFMPDCDEVVEWDLPGVEKLLDTQIDRLEYNFVFSWDNYGNPLIQFIHSKFYNRKRFKWVRNIHEVLSGEGKSQYTDKIFLKHYQNQETQRGQYLKGLAIDYIRGPYDDRNCHYFARELFYTGKFKEAIKMFEQHIKNHGWRTEQGQSYIFMGDCYKALGDRQKALECYAIAFTYDMNRREGLLSMAGIKYEDKLWNEAERLYRHALEIPKGNYYANWAPNYGHYPWGQISVCLFNQGKIEEARKALLEALRLDPGNQVYKTNLSFFPEEIPQPHVSIIIPTLGREEGLKKCTDAIKENAGYSNYDVVILKDSFENRKGVPKLVKEGTDSCSGELVMFLANDVIPQPNFLKEAVNKMYEAFGKDMDGLVGLNDMYWHGEFATHWLASKKLLPYLDGEFFHTGYHHNGCDNELTERCRKMDKYVWAEKAKVLHNHPIRADFKGEVDAVYKVAQQFYDEDRALLKKRSEEIGFELRENFIQPHIKLSAVIPFKDNLQMTRDMVESLVKNTPSLGQIILIDDGSKEDFTPHLKELERHHIPIVFNSINGGGLIKAWNLGASLATLPYIAICNNDILFSPNWDQPLINSLNDEVWMVSPYHTYGQLPTDFPNGIGRKSNIDGNITGLPYIGSCFMLKKETWNRVGPIDERLKIWCGDNFIYEMLRIDFEKEVKEIKESYIHHFGRVTSGELPSEILEQDKKTFEEIRKERNWGGRKKYCYTIPPIDLRLKLPIKDLHKLKVLNVGVGDMGSGIARQLPYLNFGRLDHIDIHQPYIDEGKKADWLCKDVNFTLADLDGYDFSGYDFVMIFDVLEHLEKEKSIKVIETLKKAFIFIPLEKEFRENHFHADSQDHKSLWVEQDFRSRGYKTTLLRNFHSDEKNRWDALWCIKY